MNNQPFQQPLRILLVDDNPHDYAAFQRAFQKSDVPAQITHETSAEPALQRLVAQSEDFDLVVTDYRLGGMNGLELCREILRLEIPVALVILTGSGSEDLAVEALKAGVDDYLIKDPDQGYFTLLPVVLPEAVRRRNDRMVRRLAEQAINAAEERLHRIMDAVADGAWDWNVQTGNLYMTPRSYRLLGCEPDGLAATYWTWVELLHPDDRDKVIAQLQDDLKSDKDTWCQEFRMRSPEGRWRWIRGNAVVVERTPDKRPLRVVGIMLDITERRLAEENEARLVRKLEIKDKELERFSRIISRQFGPPLLSIETFASELASLMNEVRDVLKAQPIDPAQKQRIDNLLATGAGSDVAYIDSAVKDMRRLLDGLAELIAVDQRPLHVEELDMDSLLEKVRTDLKDLLEQTDATLRIESLPPCRADRDWTQKIFMHLLTNALQNLDPQRPGRITVTGDLEDEMAVYCVEDNGVGIAPERQRNLFDLLPPAPDAVKGRGLGLSIVARILERLEGVIRLESEPDQGSRFYVELPAVPVTAAQEGPQYTQPPESAR
ncbi:MAG TPA: PAS domain-containing protein [Anaerohalosphaeraceae bacterium]|jgi:PAS domain S-box-containing protein|nr:PAS domain-containing protein [Anaerohalosphaeraceae bacterium]HRT49759.1 PAS domain-containing protein [Anaerohalosphaeraceae bacterium]HRT85581.1 PAS domain-containing protein [Anaerohalosphaeraceae bacterium]